MSKLVDVHTHISSPEFDSDRPSVLARALDVCEYLIDIGAGTSLDAATRARQFAEEHPEVYFTVGIHPHDADKIGTDPAAHESIEDLAKHPKCVAIGECGLDYYYNHSSKDQQIATFEWHRDLASKLKLPLMIHTRDAEEDTKIVLANYNGPAIFHCFTGSQDLADFGIKKNFFISFSGIVTFKNAEDLRRTFLKVPLENILVETDAPYLAPVPMRGKRNESSFIQHTADFLADLRKISRDEFRDRTNKNSRLIFSKIR